MTNVGAVSITGFQVPVGVEFFSSFPVVPSKSAGTEFVELAGHTTSPVHAEYCGILSVFPISVEAPLVPVVVRVIVPCFEFICVCIADVTPSKY